MLEANVVQATHGDHDNDEYDAIVDKMDGPWLKMSEQDKNIVRDVACQINKAWTNETM